MKKSTNTKILPIRLEGELLTQLEEYQTQTGLSRSYIIRRCTAYALGKARRREINLLTMEDCPQGPGQK
ncbi:MAG: hypothetical protein LBK60_07170 [Verrucomicrobiales bacterium]|jgi:hypothetical protein|nr:hypothetical protein [Verrucomicrobiales bacterium]